MTPMAPEVTHAPLPNDDEDDQGECTDFPVPVGMVEDDDEDEQGEGTDVPVPVGMEEDDDEDEQGKGTDVPVPMEEDKGSEEDLPDVPPMLTPEEKWRVFRKKRNRREAKRQKKKRMENKAKLAKMKPEQDDHDSCAQPVYPHLGGHDDDDGDENEDKGTKEAIKMENNAFK